MRTFFLSLILLLVCSIGGLAQNDSDFQTLLPEFQVFSVKTCESWSLLGISYPDGNSEGTALLHRRPSGWELVYRGGGALSEQELYHLGVPISSLPDFGYRIDASALRTIRASQPRWPRTDRAPLSEETLSLYSPWELNLMKQQILARNGQRFEDRFWKQYFQDRPWYEEDPGFVIRQLSGVALRNYKTLQKMLERIDKR